MAELVLCWQCKKAITVQILLQQPDIDVSTKGPWGSTALHWAFKDSNSVGLSLLLAHPTANPNIGNDIGIIPVEHYRNCT